MDPSAHLFLVAGVFAIAGAVKGLTGMGLPTVAMSLLGLWMAPAQAAALLVAPSLVTNIAQCRGPHLRRLAALLWPAWLGLVLTTVLAPQLAAAEGRRALGGMLVVYGLWGLWRPSIPDLRSRARSAGAAAGLATGIVTALTAVFVMPLVPFLQSLQLGKEEMVQALGLSFTVATLALALRLQAVGGVVPWSSHGLLAITAALVGLWVGTVMRGRISTAAFHKGLFVSFVALGLVNVVRAT